MIMKEKTFKKKKRQITNSYPSFKTVPTNKHHFPCCLLLITEPPAGSASTTGSAEIGLDIGNGNRVDLVEARHVTHAKSGQHVESLLVDLDVFCADGGDVGDEVHAALALFLLKLERDPADRTLLDPLDEVGREPGDLVAEALGGNDGHLLQELLVGVEIHGHARVVSLDDLA